MKIISSLKVKICAMSVNKILDKAKNCSTYCKATKCWQWKVKDILSKQNRNYAVLVLNRPIIQNHNFIQSLWNEAKVRITVDGGTSQWHKFLAQLQDNDKSALKLPDLITGDFDSITDEIKELYKTKGCQIVHTPDQNYTDFTKSLMELNKHCQTNKIELEHAIALGQASGRIDQILGNIQTLYLASEKDLLGSSNLYLLSDDALSWLLQPGDHVINLPDEVKSCKKAWCSLVPVGEACAKVTTSGLKWDLVNTSLRFGSIVSTSNTYSGSDVVKIKCSHPILWSMKIPNLLDH